MESAYFLMKAAYRCHPHICATHSTLHWM